MAFHYMGTGTGNVGRLDQPDGSYHTTQWIMFFFIPLIPLKSYRVVSEDAVLSGVPLVYAKRGMVVQPRPMDWPHVRRVYVVVVPLLLAFIALFAWSAHQS